MSKYTESSLHSPKTGFKGNFSATTSPQIDLFTGSVKNHSDTFLTCLVSDKSAHEREQTTLKVSTLKDGSGLIMKQYGSGNADNLQKGGRKEVCRESLTPFGKRQIRAGGRMLQFQNENDPDCYSPAMFTLTYGKAVPEHKTAKKHLDNFLRGMRRRGLFQEYMWVAQLQTGERALQKGLKSYRAEHGSAIHFHIITSMRKSENMNFENAQKLARSIWCKIVNDWEKSSGHEVQNIGGVDVRRIYNASNYVSRYVSNEEKTIIGNMWNMSSKMRKLIEREEKIIVVETKAFCQSSSRYKKSTNSYEKKKAKIPTVSFLDWNKFPIVISDDCSTVINDIRRVERNIERIEFKKSSPAALEKVLVEII